jgi:hypothetical protein
MRLIMEDSCHVHNSPFADGQAVFTWGAEDVNYIRRTLEEYEK